MRMTRNSEKKSKSYAVGNDTGNKTKNLILENAISKAITEVYFELLATNLLAKNSCSCNSKFVKIISILMHRI